MLADFGHSRHQTKNSYKDPKHARMSLVVKPRAKLNTCHVDGFRWQSPELMSERALISKESDVYAFAITSVEIVTMGSLPWPMKPDDVVKTIVLGKTIKFQLRLCAKPCCSRAKWPPAIPLKNCGPLGGSLDS